MVFFLFLCGHVWDPPGTEFGVFQCCHHRFQLTEAKIQLSIQFPGCSPSICMDEQIETLHFMVSQLCTAVWNVACLSCCCHHCWNVSPAASLCSHPLVRHLFSKSWWMSVGAVLSSWRNSVPPLYFTHTSMSDTVPPDAPLLPSVSQQQHVAGCWWES